MTLRRLVTYGIGRVLGVALMLMKTGNITDATFVHKCPKIRADGKIQVGAKFVTMGRIVPPQIDVDRDGTFVVGDRVFINQGSRIHASKSVEIGSRTEVGDFVAIYDTNFHEVVPNTGTKTAKVSIGEDCWIGSGSTVLPGVSLGRGCVVAAGSVVTKSFPEGSLIAGNPGQLVKSFDIPRDYARR